MCMFVYTHISHLVPLHLHECVFMKMEGDQMRSHDIVGSLSLSHQLPPTPKRDSSSKRDANWMEVEWSIFQFPFTPLLNEILFPSDARYPHLQFLNSRSQWVMSTGLSRKTYDVVIRTRVIERFAFTDLFGISSLLPFFYSSHLTKIFHFNHFFHAHNSFNFR